MLKRILSVFLLCVVLLLSACGSRTAGKETSIITDEASQSHPAAPGDSQTVPEPLLQSYYSMQSTPVFEYMQNSSIKKFLAMWVKEKTGIENPLWNYDCMAQYYILDKNFASLSDDKQLYSLPFSDGSGRNGYIVIAYYADGPAISNEGVAETTPYSYDFKAHSGKIMENLEMAGVDLSGAGASRVSRVDTENNRAGQAILFADRQNSRYICYLDDPDFAIEKSDR